MSAPDPGSEAARALGCTCPEDQAPMRQINYGCDVHGQPAHRRDQTPCRHCGKRTGDPAWTHVGDLWGDMEVVECHRIMERDPKTGKPVPKIPSEEELRQAFGGGAK